MKKLLFIALSFLLFSTIKAQTGTASTTVSAQASDKEGTVASVKWEKVSGPNTGVIVSPNNLTTALTGLTIGLYTFQITATDNEGLASTARVEIEVLPANTPPTIIISGRQTIRVK